MQLLNKKYKKALSALAKVFTAVFIFAFGLVTAAGCFIPDRICLTQTQLEEMNVFITDPEQKVSADAKLFGKIPIKTVELEVVKSLQLVPCGNVFGVKFFTKGIMVIRLSEIETEDGYMSPARQAGLKEGDVIVSVNGKEINTVEELAEIVENSKGNEMTLCYMRNDNMCETKFTPMLSLSDRKYKTGIWVRDSTAGIGTMTFYNPATGEFAGLGHGICDVDTGLLMPLLSASVVDVEITDIIRGRKGSPGELKGIFDSFQKGKLATNTRCGVYGVMEKCPQEVINKPCEVGRSDEVHEGEASILCELDENGVCEYKINIAKIRGDDTEGKNFVIEVADDRLLGKTGGIVQGMSGSPIMQDGKLVGAVTHVLVSTPSKGYGIFIENMLNACKS